LISRTKNPKNRDRFIFAADQLRHAEDKAFTDKQKINPSRFLAVSRPSRSPPTARDHVILSEAKDLLTTRALTSLREPVTIVTIVRVLETKRKTGTDLFSLRTNAGRERRYSYVENKSFPVF
jgi:hypothetical protein